MYTTNVMAHDYVSASSKIDQALERFHSAGPGDDPAFHNLIITLVDEACSGAKLYMPMANKRFNFTKQNVPVYALYTDKTMAEACASACMNASGTLFDPTAGFPHAEEQTLMSVIDKSVVGLALNMGLPTQILLPPNVVHTIHHLCITHQCKAVEPEGSSWTEWIAIMNRYFEQQARNGFRGQTQDKPETRHAQETQLRIPIIEVEAPPPLAIYLGPKPEPRYELA